MNRKGFQLVLTGAIGLLLAGALSAGTDLSVAIDTRRHLQYVDDAKKNHTDVVMLYAITNSVDNLLGLVYNNTTNWVKGGDTERPLPVIRLVEMNANGATNNPVAWTDTAAVTNIAPADREGLVSWTSDRRAFYRAELVVDGGGTVETNEVAYFDFSACTDAGIRRTLSCFAQDQASFLLHYDPLGKTEPWIEATLVDEDGNEIAPENYRLRYDVTKAVPGASIDVWIDGLNTWGGSALFKDVMMVVERIMCQDELTGDFDTRRHLRYLDDAATNHVDTLMLYAVTNSSSELLALAYNNTTNWVREGDNGAAAPVIRLVEMNAHGTPELVTNWTDTIAITNLAFTDREGFVSWMSDRQAYYRAELIVGTATNRVAYFDFNDCTDAGIRKTLSCFGSDQGEFLLHYDPTKPEGEKFWITAVLRDFDGNVIADANYWLEYDRSQARSGNLIDITVHGVNAWGGKVLFGNAQLFTERVVATNGISDIDFDTRRHLVYVDGTKTVDGRQVTNHVDTVTLIAITNKATELLGFASNNTTNWVRCGDAGAAFADVHVVEQNARGVTNNPAVWTDTRCETNYPGTCAEEVRALGSDRKAFYRAELLVDGGETVSTNAVVYFDFSACEDAVKGTVSVFEPDQVELWMVYDFNLGWLPTGNVTDPEGNPMTGGVDYSLYYVEGSREVFLQGIGSGWGGRYVVTKPSYKDVTVSADTDGSAVDTRRCIRIVRPEGEDEGIYSCRTYETAADILTFAYDTNWVSKATNVLSVTVAPCVVRDEEDPRVRILDEGRRDRVAAEETIGTNDWQPVVYKGYYEARIVEQTSDGLVVTNLVDLDLGEATDLIPYPGVDVVYPNGDKVNYPTIWLALDDAAERGGAESVWLRVDRREDLVLDENEKVVFLGGDYTLDGDFIVPESARLTILSGTYTSNPEDPVDYVPPSCETTKDKKAPGTWTVEYDWLVGAFNPEDIIAYLTEDGNLLFIGGGEMKSWGASVGKDVPWADYRNVITNAIVSPRVTGIGSEAFCNCTNLIAVTMPGTIRNIGRDAFKNCNTNGTDVAKGVNFVTVTYRPAKEGAPASFEAKNLAATGGKFTGGTFDYNPEATTEAHPTNEVADGYEAYSDVNDTYTIGEVWAINVNTDTKYNSVDNALRAAGDSNVVCLVRGTAGVYDVVLQPALDRGVVVTGEQWLAVYGSITNGTLKCPVRILDDPRVVGVITGGDFYDQVATKDGVISGGTFSIRPLDSQIAPGYGIVETDDEPARYKVVPLGTDAIRLPRIVPGLSYTGANQVGVICPDGEFVTVTGGPTNATDVGVYTAQVTPVTGKTWPDGTTATRSYKWGIAPLLEGTRTGYDPETDGWKITLIHDLTGPLVIPDGFGDAVGGRVELDLNGFTIKGAPGWQPAAPTGHPDGYPALTVDDDAIDLKITGPGTLEGGDGADGVPSSKKGGSGVNPIDPVTGAKVTVGDGVTQTKGKDGTDWSGDDPAKLLVTVVDSRDEYLALAIPYANTNVWEGTEKPTLESLLRRTTLAAGDETFVYDHVKRTVALYRLGTDDAWKPVPVIEVTTNGWTTTVGTVPCVLEPGYGFWLRRVEQSHRANKVYLQGYQWEGPAMTVSIEGSTKTTRGKTLVSNPYGDLWDLNDTARVNWSGIAAEGDWIQVNGDASAIYQYTGGKWKPRTFNAKDAKLPAGYGFWYIRAKGAGATTLTF